MNTIKVIGGVAAGIGTVSALPVMGKFGRVSLLGAVLGGTIGGLAGAAIAIKDDEDSDARSSLAKDEGWETCYKALDELDGDLEEVKAALAEQAPGSRISGLFEESMVPGQEELDEEDLDEEDLDEEDPDEEELVGEELVIA